jgi:hypothetical protein
MEGGDVAVLEQHVVEGEQDLPVGWRPVVGVRRDDEDGAVEAHLLAVVLADVRVVPVCAGIRELEAVLEPLADSDRLLGLVRPVVAVVQTQAVPMDRGLQVALVLGVDDDLRPLGDLEGRARDRAVVGQHPHAGVSDALLDRCDPQVERIAVGQLHEVGPASGRQPLRVGRKPLYVARAHRCSFEVLKLGRI